MIMKKTAYDMGKSKYECELKFNYFGNECYQINLESDEFFWHYLRGFIEDSLIISNKSCTFKAMDENVLKKIGIHDQSKLDITLKEYEAMNFLYNLYKDSDYIRNEKLYKIYVSNFLQSKNPLLSFYIEDENALVPSKVRASDIGWDLTIIKKVKTYSNKIAMYDTGIKVIPEFGYYTEIVPRSSLSKTGYMLANSIGIIDPEYRGTLKIVLTKIDDSLPDIVLPFKCAQLIIRKMEHSRYNIIENVEETSRNEGGFGSTG